MSGTFYPEAAILKRIERKTSFFFLTRGRIWTRCAYALAHIFGQKTRATWGLCEKLNDSYTQRVSSFSIQPKIIDSLHSFDTVVCGLSFSHAGGRT